MQLALVGRRPERSELGERPMVCTLTAKLGGVVGQCWQPTSGKKVLMQHRASSASNALQYHAGQAARYGIQGLRARGLVIANFRMVNAPGKPR